MPRPRTAGRLGADHRPQIAARLAQARRLRGLTAAELGAALGVSQQQVGHYEAARHSLSAGALLEIARILELPVSFFYDDCPSVTAAALPPADCLGIALDCAALPLALRRSVAAMVADMAAPFARDAAAPHPIAPHPIAAE